MTTNSQEAVSDTRPRKIGFVEARFELGETVAASLQKGDAVVITGGEHALSGVRATSSTGAVIDADSIGADLPDSAPRASSAPGTPSSGRRR